MAVKCLSRFLHTRRRSVTPHARARRLQQHLLTQSHLRLILPFPSSPYHHESFSLPCSPLLASRLARPLQPSPASYFLWIRLRMSGATTRFPVKSFINCIPSPIHPGEPNMPMHHRFRAAPLGASCINSKHSRICENCDG